MKSFLLTCALLLCCLNAGAVIETYQFDTPLQQQRYHAFIEELRCPKCQNQNLSGSDSEISKDLRRQIHRMIMDGKADIEITQYMVARYGDFILYRPRFNGQTAVLWFAPLVLLALGLLVWWRMAASRKNSLSSQHDSLTEAEQARLQELLIADDVADSRGRE
ncbi:Cytochrome c-type biogenesis protein CcmH [Zhongshania aliphaticivorans]|uniref:Cytochrome c-type biogenesis protein n=1 Tax=Zhongshania aliphaticivorans TaxID=1470434 RepID=A0A5S9QDH1_9GAMM|nr:cytochrome c-type biogenesis protein [Zhongshania aliphaticivorans]CAA0087809.1 Cytochrome c-type biogenesis protein CcmH [Zhongshania aliphaticivorans]CAA0115491.1 Cytochrome c-type biogenesis protein CcmH [Zhongshania aliphaticivorans]CAA0120243.1 Cytochrome c-type biogenesis protein CcmH [Zhongshania aliphaticivorans]